MIRKQYLWTMPVLIGLLWVITAIPVAAQYPDSTATPFRIEVSKLRRAQIGSLVTVVIKKIDGSAPMYGFDFLLGYDTTVAKFAGAYRPQLFSQPGAYEWEYLAVDPHVPAECPSTGHCPPGRVRIIGMADIDNGDHHPLQYTVPDDSTLCVLTFRVTSDSTFECMATAIPFYWQTCNDNTILIDTLSGLRVVSRAVVDYNMGDISNPEYGLPGLYGLPDTCLVSASIPQEARFVDFFTGVIDIICYDSIDSRGDINRNGVAYEVVDWLMFTNYMLAGFGAFATHETSSIAASDINLDGIGLELADLIYLKRVECGDTLPLPLKSGYRSVLDSITFIQDVGTRTVSVEYPDTLAAVFLVFEGNIEPTFLIDTSAYYCSYLYDGRFTVVLVQYGPRRWYLSDCGSGFTAGPLFTYTGNGILVHEGSDERKTSAATFDDHIFPNPTLEITGSYNGAIAVEPDTLLWHNLRLSADVPSQVVAIYVGGFTDHSADDIDLASVRVNDSIVPASIEIIPSHPDFSGSVLKLMIPALQLADSFGERPFAATPLSSFLISMTDFQYVVEVSGDFMDRSSFISLGGITLLDRPVAIHVPTGWPTIAEAVDTARIGDTIIIEDGVFTGDGNRDIVVERQIAIRSEHGPAYTTIDCQGSAADPHRVFLYTGTYDAMDIIEGLTITGAYSTNLSPIWKNRGSILMRNCVVHHNRSFAGVQPAPIVNVSDGFSRMEIDSCTFSGNTANMVLRSYFRMVIHNSVIAFNDAAAMNPTMTHLEITCTDLYDNDLGDWSGYLADRLGVDGNISRDPVFCDTAAGDYHLSGFSPCLPAGNDCQEIMGVYGMECGAVCGEIDGDDGINIADVVYLINYIFRDGPPPVNLSAADTNANGDIDVGDAIALVNYIFQSAPAIDCASQ